MDQKCKAASTTRVTSPWGSDDDSKMAKKQSESLSEGEWSGPDEDNSAGARRWTGDISGVHLEDKLAAAKTNEPVLRLEEGPALPPSFPEKLKRKRRRSAKAKPTKKRKKTEKTKKPKTGAKLTKDKVETQPSIAVPPTPTEKATVVQNNDVTRSKWDSTDEDIAKEVVDDELSNLANPEMPSSTDRNIVSGVVGAEHLLKTKKHQHGSGRGRHKKRRHTKEKKKSTQSSSVSEEQNWEEVGKRHSKKDVSKEKSLTNKSSADRKKSQEGCAPLPLVRRPSKAKGSSARLFEQARNVLLKAEAELAAMGYRDARNALSGKLHRSRSSTSRSRSSSRRQRRRHRRRDSHDSRYRSRSSSRSSTDSRSSFSSSRSSSRRASRSRTVSSKSQKGRRVSSTSSLSHSGSSTRSSSATPSNSKSPVRAPKKPSEEDGLVQNASREAAVSAVNIPRKVKVDVTGVVGTSVEKMISLPKAKTKSKEKGIKIGKQQLPLDDNDPYSEKSRRKNKMHKALKKLEETKQEDTLVTAASVRKAEKAKKQKKLKAEQRVWQPPLEYGEEDDEASSDANEAGSDHKNKLTLKTRTSNSFKRRDVKGGALDGARDIPEEYDIDEMLSSGIEGVQDNKTFSGEIFEKRAKHAELFKKKLQEKLESDKLANVECVADQISTTEEKPLLPNGNKAASGIQEIVSGFGIMPKFSPKKEVKQQPVIMKEPEAKPTNPDLDSIWPEDNPKQQKETIKPGLRVPVKSVQQERKLQIDENDRCNNKPTLQDASKMDTKDQEAKPFRVQQYNLAKEENQSSESEQEWVPTKLQSSKKTITFNIKLPMPPALEPKIEANAKSGGPKRKDQSVERGRKRSRKHRKKDKKKVEEPLTTLEMVARQLRKHREKRQSEEEDKNKDIAEETVKQTSITTSITSTAAVQTTEAPANNNIAKTTAGNNTVLPVQPNQNARPAVNIPRFQRLPYPAHPYQSRMRVPMHPPRGYPPPPFFNGTMMHPMGMRYPLGLPPFPPAPNMPPLPDTNEPPPLPEEQFPQQPPEPKERTCKLTDSAVTDLFKKKIISAERLSLLLEQDDSKDEIRVPSPAPSLTKEKPHKRHRSYRRRRRSSSSDSSSYSRSSSRSRRRSSSYSDRSRSYSSYSSDYSSDSDRSHSRSSHRCKHRLRRSYSSSRHSRRRSYSSSRSRSRSYSRRRSRKRSRGASSDSYSSDSDYSGYSRSASRSRRRSTGGSKRHSSYGSRRTRSP